MKNNVIWVDFTAKQKRKSKLKKVFLSMLKNITSFFHKFKKDNKTHGDKKSVL
ncbi:hypothetical protein HMPREF1982_00915 [Clostridiales bacterium oral taxon 876 str. F0540]|nr:hypothetical protein HMPREF1982_00915 [Clostridiales bacterium oral taxon 876 str. F0540]